MLLLVAALSTLLLIAIIVIDLRTQIIPDALNLALGWLAVVYLALTMPINFWLWYAGSAAALGALGAFFAGPYSKWRGRDMLGWGDVKFFIAAGLWIPLPEVSIFLFLAGIFGIIGALAYKARTGRAETPFAPALCVALWLCVWQGDTINRLITNLF